MLATFPASVQAINLVELQGWLPANLTIVFVIERHTWTYEAPFVPAFNSS